MNNTNGFVIDSGIPMPVPKSRGFSATLRQLQVGQSFIVSGARSTSGCSGSIGNVKRTTGFEFAARRVEGGVRIWRIK